MTLEIDRSQATSQLMSINEVLTAVATSAQSTKLAINGFLWSPDLQGSTYDGFRSHYGNLHIPVLNGIISYVDEMLAANNAYNYCSGILTDCYLNEAALLEQSKIVWNLNNNVAPYFPTYAVTLMDMIRRITIKLESLYKFDSLTHGFYVTSTDILADINTGISIISSCTYNSSSKSFSYPFGAVPFMEWRDRINEIYEKKQKEGMKALVFDANGKGSVRGFDPSYAFSKDPVNLGTGNFIYSHEDLKIAGI
jgi:hypothetical protein